MKPMDIYSGTAQFCRLKFLLGLGMTLLTTLLYVVMVGLPTLAAVWLSYILLPFWAALSVFLCVKLYRSVGYRIDGGHIAIITGAIADGYIPRNIAIETAELLEVPLAKIYGVVTFYNFFKLFVPVFRHIIIALLEYIAGIFKQIFCIQITVP